VKHGHHLPKDKRPAMARRALELFQAEKKRNIGLAVVQEEFNISEPTARNLVSYGRYLATNPDKE
jgi:hypothetical protein